MARIRTIKPEFFTSDTVSSLPLRARLTWIGLWTHCDDHGRCRDNVKLIKAAVWPLDDVSLRDIEEDLVVLAEHDCIVRYIADGREYLAIPSWDEHQSASHRRGPPRHPPPPDSIDAPGQPTDASRTTDHASRTTGRAGTGNREQGTGTADTTRFDDFWTHYPRKVSKADALKAWKKLDASDHKLAIQAIPQHARAWELAKTEPQFIPHASRWLNARRFEDDIRSERPRVNGAHVDKTTNAQMSEHALMRS